ncbi:MAG: glycosyltransferase family 2 protein [Microbacteriaceae bacterium]
MASKAKLPAISVILPVLNEEAFVASAVHSVLAQKYSGEIEVLLVLGPSTDGTDAVAQDLVNKDGRLRIIENPRGKTTIGMNLAISAARHEIVVRVDAHTELAEGYLQRGVEILQETGADELGGIMQARGHSPIQRAVAWAYSSRFGVGGANFHVGGQPGEAESAYLGIFQKSALVRVGGYDETIVRGEDWDLAQRIRKTGGLVWFSPELKVTYWPRARYDHLVKQFWSTGVWRGEITRRNFAAASKRYFAPPLLLAAVVGCLALLLAGHPLAIAPIAGYLSVVLLLAATASDLSLAARFWVLVVLPTIHLTWGAGFWRGLLFGAGTTLDRSRVSK